VKLALENMPEDDFLVIRELFARYPPEFLGLCYDSGHGNIGGRGLHHLAAVKERLAAVHLHDNKGFDDSHDLPFSGTVDWQRLTVIMAESSYAGCVSLESNMRGEPIDEAEYLTQAYETATRLSLMIGEHQVNNPQEVRLHGAR
jgi:sugar phosphate isomerase/epimerase